jgi:hypothetical protein
MGLSQNYTNGVQIYKDGTFGNTQKHFEKIMT